MQCGRCARAIRRILNETPADCVGGCAWIDRLESIRAVKVHMDAQMERAAIRTTDHREGSPQSV
jgi:hypothetical protein